MRHANGRWVAEDAGVKFWRTVRFGDCWEWQGSLDKDGYGHFSHPRGVRRAAHRVSWERHYGPIPEGLTIDHLCRNRQCVRPDHLEPVTVRENIMRGNGPGAKNAAKTACPRGHPYRTLRTTGERWCVACHVESNRRYRARRRA